MDENNQTQPKNYSQYMGTLNRIYRRGNKPQAKKLGDGIGSLKKGADTQQPENGTQLSNRDGGCGGRLYAVLGGDNGHADVLIFLSHTSRNPGALCVRSGVPA